VKYLRVTLREGCAFHACRERPPLPWWMFRVLFMLESTQDHAPPVLSCQYAAIEEAIVVGGI